jgi:hypothetical protein
VPAQCPGERLTPPRLPDRRRSTRSTGRSVLCDVVGREGAPRPVRVADLSAEGAGLVLPWRPSEGVLGLRLCN